MPDAPAEPPAATPSRVIAFTGHRIDDPDREAKGLAPRFPRAMEATARAAIRRVVERERAGAGGALLGVAGGASGGDILFHEVCGELGIPTRLYLALPRDPYVAASVQSAGPEWVRRFDRLYEVLTPMVLAKSPGEAGDDVWQRNNLWILGHALDQAGDGRRLTLIALWNGKRGDGPGGTEDMVNQARRRGARTVILDTEQLFGLAGRDTA
jgi:hypothetical protein